jgi:hypothetical protein
VVYFGRYASRSDVSGSIVNFDRVVGSYTIKLLHLVINYGIVMVLYVSADDSLSD